MSKICPLQCKQSENEQQIESQTSNFAIMVWAQKKKRETDSHKQVKKKIHWRRRRMLREIYLTTEY